MRLWLKPSGSGLNCIQNQNKCKVLKLSVKAMFAAAKLTRAIVFLFMC